MEERRRAEVEEIEEAARANLEKLMEAFNAQVRAIQLKQRKATSKAIKEIESGLRCHVCRRKNCVFHKQPWKAHWKTLGGALDLHPFDPTINANLSVLMGTATEHEWHEAKLTDQTERRDRRAKSRMHSMLSGASAAASRLEAGSSSYTAGTSAAIGDLSHISVSPGAHDQLAGSDDGSPTRPHTSFALGRGLPGAAAGDASSSAATPSRTRPASAASTIRTAVRISRAVSASRQRGASPHHDRPFYNSCTNPTSHRCMPDTVSRNTKVTARQA
jgi:hypothetical protein